MTKNSKESPFSYEERRQIFYQNYAASITDEEWKEIEREERERIRSMGKGKRSHLLIRANTKSSENHATKFLSYYKTKEILMTTNQNQISHQAKKFTITLDQLVARFGDTLNNFTKIDKLDLLRIVIFWQGADLRNIEYGLESISLGEFLTLNPSVKNDISQDVNQALKILVDCTESDALAIMTAIVHQLNDYRQG